MKRSARRAAVATLGQAALLGLIPAMLTFTLSELAPDEDQGLIFILASAPQPSGLVSRRLRASCRREWSRSSIST